MLGSASMAAFMTTRISAEMPLAADGPAGEGSVTRLPSFLHEPFAAAMSQSLLLPAFIALFGVVGALFLLGFARDNRAALERPDDDVDEYWDDDYVDDDEYVEFMVHHDEPEPVAAVADVHGVDDEGDTEPMAARHWGHSPASGRYPHPPEGQGEHLLTAPAEVWHDEPAESAAPTAQPADPPRYPRQPGRSLFDFLADVPPPKPSVEPIGFAHNGFHVDDEQRFQPVSRYEASPEPELPGETHTPDILSPDYPLDFGRHAHHESPDEAGFDSPSRRELTDEEPEQYPFHSNGRHSRVEPDDASSYGRHYRPGD